MLTSWQTYMCYNLRVPHRRPPTSLLFCRAGLMKLDSWHPDSRWDSHESGTRHTSLCLWPSFLKLPSVSEKRWEMSYSTGASGPYRAAILLYCLHRGRKQGETGREWWHMFACECVETRRGGTNSRCLKSQFKVTNRARPHPCLHYCRKMKKTNDLKVFEDHLYIKFKSPQNWVHIFYSSHWAPTLSLCIVNRLWSRCTAKTPPLETSKNILSLEKIL